MMMFLSLVSFYSLLVARLFLVLICMVMEKDKYAVGW